MVICKACGRVITRESGVRVVYEKGDSLTISSEEASRLEKLKAVEDIEHIDDYYLEEDPNVFLTEEQLKEKNKDELIIYAASLGLELDKSTKKEPMIYAICDFIAEQAESEAC